MAATAPRAKAVKLTLTLTDQEVAIIDRDRKTSSREAYIKKLILGHDPSLKHQVEEVMRLAKSMGKTQHKALEAKPHMQPIPEAEASKVAREAVRKHRDEKAKGRI